MSWMRHNMTLVTHSMWSFWGWVEQSTLKCIDLCFFIIIIVIIIIFNGGNPPVTNPHHYHYCQNPTMVGFWLVGICWGTMMMMMMWRGRSKRRRMVLVRKRRRPPAPATRRLPVLSPRAIPQARWPSGARIITNNNIHQNSPDWPSKFADDLWCCWAVLIK